MILNKTGLLSHVAELKAILLNLNSALDQSSLGWIVTFKRRPKDIFFLLQ